MICCNKFNDTVLQQFSAAVVYSANVTDSPYDSDDEDSVYVLSEFEGDVFHQLCNSYCRIVAPPVVMWAATQGEVSKLVDSFYL